MAHSKAFYQGDGSTKQFAVPFPYISQTDVKVRVNELLVSTSDYSWTSNTVIEFDTAPVSTDDIEIYRETQRGSRLVDYQNGSALSETVLDTDSLQAFYLAQELLDITEQSILASSDGHLTASGKTIQDVGDPVNDKDAANKEYVDGRIIAGAQGPQGPQGPEGPPGVTGLNLAFGQFEINPITGFLEVSYYGGVDENDFSINAQGIMEVTA